MLEKPENNLIEECKQTPGTEKEKSINKSDGELENKNKEEKKDDLELATNSQNNESKINSETPPQEKDGKDGKLNETSINAMKIENLFKFDNDLNIFSNNDGMKKSFEDPTDPLPEKFAQVSVFKDNIDIINHMNKLKERHVVLLNCMNMKILKTMGNTFIKKAEFKSYQVRILSFSGRNKVRDDLYPDIFLTGKIGNGKKMVILVEIDKHVGFWDSISSGSFQNDLIVERFRENDIVLICLVNSELMANLVGEKLKEGVFHHWNIEFLPYLLELYFPDRVEELIGEINKQRESALWGDKNNDREFYDLFYKLFLDGRDALLEGIKERSREMVDGNISEGRDKKKIRAEDIFREQEPHKTVLYTATFFPGLSPIDFDGLVRFFLVDKTITIDYKKQVVSDNGEIKTIISQDIKKISEIWDEESDKILSECYLKAVKPDESAQIIDFLYPFFRQGFRKIFEEIYSIYLMKQFRLIQTSGLLFAPDVSPSITDNIIHMTVEMVILNPEHYGFDWLLQVIYQIKNQFNIQHEPKDDLIDIIFKFIENEENKSYLYYRIAGLIRQMLNHQQLNKVVNSFLEKLFNNEFYDVVLQLVLKVGKQLLFSTTCEFDSFEWMKRILNEEKEDLNNEEMGDIKMQTYQALHQLASERDFHIFEILDIIRKWLPDEKVLPEKYSSSNNYAILFIVEYCLKTLALLNEKYYGEWPSKYPLFYALNNDKSLVEERISNLIVWLFHPGVEKVVKKMKNKSEEDKYWTDFDINVFVAFLLEQWGVVLFGNEYNNSNSNAIELLEIIMHKIAITANTDSLRKILNWMAEFQIYYRDELSKLSNENKEKRQPLLIKYHLSRKVFTLFTKYISRIKGVNR